jgi:hypothetical protein
MEKQELLEEDLSVSSVSTDDDSISASDDDDDVDLEEEDLLDRQVWEKAKELRKNVRDASRKLQLVREEKIGQAMARIQSQVDDLIHFEKKWSDEMERNMEHGLGECNSVVNTDEMEAALKKVKEQLENLENVLPENLKAIRDTIESVSISVQKKLRGELSKTEKAIQLRDCDDVWRRKGDKQTIHDREEVGQHIDAAKRFALFVSRS